MTSSWKPWVITCNYNHFWKCDQHSYNRLQINFSLPLKTVSQATVQVLRLQIYQDGVMDLLGGLQLTLMAANQEYVDTHCQLMADFSSLKVDYGSDNSITEFPCLGETNWGTFFLPPKITWKEEAGEDKNRTENGPTGSQKGPPLQTWDLLGFFFPKGRNFSDVDWHPLTFIDPCMCVFPLSFSPWYDSNPSEL